MYAFVRKKQAILNSPSNFIAKLMLDLAIVEKYSSGGKEIEIYRVLFEFKVTLSGEAKLNKRRPKDLKA